MKCKAAVVWQDRRKKGTGAPIKTPKVLMASPDHTDTQAEFWRPRYEAALTTPGAVVCDGDVECVEVAAEEEPTWGGTYASLTVTYRCNKCASECYPVLAGNEGVRDLVNEALKARP